MPIAYGGLTGTLQDAAEADGDGTAFDVRGAARVTVQVSGTFTANVNFEGTLSEADEDWFAVALLAADDETPESTVSAAGLWKRPPDLALTQLRASISDYSDGTVTVVALKEY